MPYSTDFVCTYHLYYDSDDADSDEADKNLLYQMQFLQAFGLREYDTAKIDETLTELAEKIETDPKLRDAIMKHPLLGSPDTASASCADILPFLFTYNSFHAFHKCVIDLYGHVDGGGGTVSDENLAALFNTYATISS
jgi:hypothetical protein